jgi:F-type H+-transporting ATPase subunit b
VSPALAAAGGGNFLIPNMTFVVELTAFIIVLGVLWRYVIPPVRQAMNARQEMARKLVSDSEQAKQLLEQAQTAYKTATADARHEAARLRAQAEQQRREIIEGASAAAEAGVAEIMTRGQAQAEAERRQAIRQLKTELGNLAVDLAEKILGEALADNERQDRLIERFLSNIEEEANAGRVASTQRREPRGLSLPVGGATVRSGAEIQDLYPERTVVLPLPAQTPAAGLTGLPRTCPRRCRRPSPGRPGTWSWNPASYRRCHRCT